jgi:hypothetical protein
VHSIKSCHIDICRNILGIYLEKWHYGLFWLDAYVKKIKPSVHSN